MNDIKALPQGLLKDIAEGIITCSTPEYFGRFNISVNIQAGQVRNVNYTTERCKKYE